VAITPERSADFLSGRSTIGSITITKRAMTLPIGNTGQLNIERNSSDFFRYSGGI
jgi:hypothetical protein